MKVVSVHQIRAIEKSADSNGINYEQMMINAGKGIADWILENLAVNAGVIGLIGSGNNGGDTLIALTKLSKHGVRTSAFLVKNRKNDILISDYISTGGEIVDLKSKQNIEKLKAALIPGAVLLDGILGTGFRLPLRGKLPDIMTLIAQLARNRSEILKIAIDCPSGIDCDTGEVATVTLPAHFTLCMAAVKQGLLKPPARAYTGEMVSIDIGIGELSSHLKINYPEMLDSPFVSKNLPKRSNTGHKGTFGTCLVIAGSEPYIGAAYLAGKAAYLAGCGLVRVATQKNVQHCLGGELVEAVWTKLPEESGSFSLEGVEILKEDLHHADSLVVGPGWGVSDKNTSFLIKLLKAIPNDLPTIFDADGLKLLHNIDHWSTLLPDNVILTPHPGEMAILTGMDVKTIQSNRWEIAQSYAERWDVNLVLKGAMTVVATPTKNLYINPVSDSALATAGSGDVLSGLIGGFLAQRVTASKAAVLGVWIHAQAGVAAHHWMETDACVTAKDILNNVYVAFRRY